MAEHTTSYRAKQIVGKMLEAISEEAEIIRTGTKRSFETLIEADLEEYEKMQLDKKYGYEEEEICISVDGTKSLPETLRYEFDSKTSLKDAKNLFRYTPFMKTISANTNDYELEMVISRHFSATNPQVNVIEFVPNHNTNTVLVISMFDTTDGVNKVDRKQALLACFWRLMESSGNSVFDNARFYITNSRTGTIEDAFIDAANRRGVHITPEEVKAGRK